MSDSESNVDIEYGSTGDDDNKDNTAWPECENSFHGISAAKN